MNLSAAILPLIACQQGAHRLTVPDLIGTWKGRIERPGLGGERRMAQVGTGIFGRSHRFSAYYPDPDQKMHNETGTWTLRKGKLTVITGVVGSRRTRKTPRAVEVSFDPVELRLPLRDGTWFLVARRVTP